MPSGAPGKMRVVVIGGGTGLSTLLRGLKTYWCAACPPPSEPVITALTAIVTVTDEGGSSGRLRRDFRVLPPGDIRNCLVALAEDEALLARLFDYRFKSGAGLIGHSFGNLFLTVLTDLTGDFAEAVRISGEVLAICGNIYPATLADVRLKALLKDGRTIFGESTISRTHVPIRKLELVPRHPKPFLPALDAIRKADLITIGPGSLFTSLIPNLLVRGFPQALAESKACKVYVSNLMTQPGETSHYTAADHIRALVEHARLPIVRYAALNQQPVPTPVLRRYARQRAEPVANDLDKIRELGVEPVFGDLVAVDHVVRHDPARLAELILSLAAKAKRTRVKAR